MIIAEIHKLVWVSYCKLDSSILWFLFCFVSSSSAFIAIARMGYPILFPMVAAEAGADHNIPYFSSHADTRVKDNVLIPAAED